MVSVIVPIYNVEPYLNQCIDSIIAQTYRDLEIILVDDGSTDRCGAICDSYSDPRIAVYHTENRGLSAARNLGIEKSHGEFLYFIDSDDWIDSELVEQAIVKIEDADVLCFEKNEGIYNGFEAMCEYINGRISVYTWNKLYSQRVFSTIRFPEGRIMEDIATTHKLLYHSQKTICAHISGYHHRYRENSLSQTHDLKNIIDYWLAVKEQYDFCNNAISSCMKNISAGEMKKVHINLLKYWAIAIARAWGWRLTTSMPNVPEWKTMSCEVRTMFPYHVRRHFSLRIRGGLFLARFNHPIPIWIAYKLHMLT